VRGIDDGDLWVTAAGRGRHGGKVRSTAADGAEQSMRWGWRGSKISLLLDEAMMER
jgi:hypothetical protein